MVVEGVELFVWWRRRRRFSSNDVIHRQREIPVQAVFGDISIPV